MYVRGYLQGSENGRVVTIAVQVSINIQKYRHIFTMPDDWKMNVKFLVMKYMYVDILLIGSTFTMSY